MTVPSSFVVMVPVEINQDKQAECQTNETSGGGCKSKPRNDFWQPSTAIKTNADCARC